MKFIFFRKLQNMRDQKFIKLLNWFSINNSYDLKKYKFILIKKLFEIDKLKSISLKKFIKKKKLSIPHVKMLL